MKTLQIWPLINPQRGPERFRPRQAKSNHVSDCSSDMHYKSHCSNIDHSRLFHCNPDNSCSLQSIPKQHSKMIRAKLLGCPNCYRFPSAEKFVKNRSQTNLHETDTLYIQADKPLRTYTPVQTWPLQTISYHCSFPWTNTVEPRRLHRSKPFQSWQVQTIRRIQTREFQKHWLRITSILKATRKLQNEIRNEQNVASRKRVP